MMMRERYDPIKVRSTRHTCRHCRGSGIKASRSTKASTRNMGHMKCIACSGLGYFVVKEIEHDTGPR